MQKDSIESGLSAQLVVKPRLRDVKQRLDIYLANYFSGLYSRTYLQKLITDKNVTVMGRFCKPNYKIRQSDVIDISIPSLKTLTVQPEDIPLDIIYEDKDIIIINKPQGMVVHPGAGVKSGTLANALLHHCKDLSGIGGVLRPGIVHRLDKDTSGIMLVAKNDLVHRALSKQFKQRKVERKYTALVNGVVDFDNDEIDLPMGKHPKDRKKMGITRAPVPHSGMVRGSTFLHSKDAKTRYKVLKRFSDSTLLEIVPITGRTHQIRVHMKAIGHPIAGDTKYGIKGKMSLPRQMLHAKWIRFFHPTLKKYMEFSCDLPQDMARFIFSHF